MKKSVVVVLTLLGLVFPAPSKEKSPKAEKTNAAKSAPSPWGPWLEPDFPFFSSVLDARALGEGFPKDNLTPRGIILNLGHNIWACYDTDLLRLACVWQGMPGQPPITQNALAPGSYHVAGQKTKDGQYDLPKIIGTPLMANGIYPGWQLSRSPVGANAPVLSDPREPAPTAQEPGRGALPARLGRFLGLRMTAAGVAVECEVGGSVIREIFSCVIMDGGPLVCMDFDVDHPTKEIAQIIGFESGATTGRLVQVPGMKASRPMQLWKSANDCWGLYKQKEWTSPFRVKLQFEKLGPLGGPEAPPTTRHWPQTVTTTAKLGTSKDSAYVIDDIPLPLENPWKRNVRLADIAFLDDKGHAAGVTMDGDVWLISGLTGDLNKVTWKRFASGLHEPMSIVARPASFDQSNPKSEIPNPKSKEIYVFDRNGIWRLRDTQGSGEADTYEMFCNLFAQTAETREFPNSMKLAPDGSFVISKGGQEGTTLGKHNGTVIRVAPDGKSFQVIGWGLRQPFVGVHPKTGLVTASDQEGNYVPTTPIHIIKDHQYYGFLSELLPHEKYPQTIADPVVWIPHSVNASGATQVWLVDAKMGSMNDECIHLGYNRPEVFRILFNKRFAKPQAAAVSFTRNLAFAPLNGAVNPADGQLYVTGFQIWGTTATAISGLARIRYTGQPRVLLKEVTPMDKGLLLRFNLPLDKALASNPDNFSIERWNYHRTYKYGSPQLKLDGKPGTDFLTASSAYLSQDGKSVLVGIPDMKTGVMQMRVGWGLKGADGSPAHNSAYITPYELANFDPAKEGFGAIQVDMTPRKALAAVQTRPTVEEGQRLYQMMGCMACHSTDGSNEGKVGPTWKGLYGSERLLKDGKTTVTADDAYLKESMLDPSAKIVKGYEKLDTGMPIYAGVLNDSQIEALILFIKTLK